MSLKRGQAEEKILDVDASMQGTLSFKDPVNLRINGKFEGTLETRGNLTISKSAEVKANITGDNIMIAGKVIGDIIARNTLAIMAPGALKGNVRVNKISIEVGASFEGNCKMGQSIMDMDELSRYLEVDSSSILEWVNAGKIPARKEGKDWRFERKQIDEWIASGKMA